MLSPPPRGDKPLITPSAPSDNKPAVESSKSPADKFAALKAYCRARGLCDCCAEKWHPGHQFSISVQLNVVQELVELFSLDDSETADSALSPDPIQHEDAQLSLILSKEAISGSEGPRTMRFMGSIGEHQLQILVDSGSTHTFLSQAMADQLQGVSQLSVPLTVQCANEGIIQCVSILLAASWSIQGIMFSSDLKVVPLPHFDLIIGMDWLESFSP